jgi:hypothetical protein
MGFGWMNGGMELTIPLMSSVLGLAEVEYASDAVPRT